MSVEKQLSSSNFLINFLAVREMRMKQVKREDVEECLKIEQEKEKTWKKVMKVLIQAFERHQMDLIHMDFDTYGWNRTGNPNENSN